MGWYTKEIPWKPIVPMVDGYTDSHQMGWYTHYMKNPMKTETHYCKDIIIYPLCLMVIQWWLINGDWLIYPWCVNSHEMGWMTTTMVALWLLNGLLWKITRFSSINHHSYHISMALYVYHKKIRYTRNNPNRLKFAICSITSPNPYNVAPTQL